MGLKELTNLVRTNINKVEKGGIAEALHAADVFKKAGITANMRVGDPRFKEGTATPLMGVEWYAGSLVDCVEEECWFAINSLINCLDRFCPEIKEATDETTAPV